jgi:inorganic phosphate transporter, PiT family
VEQTSFAFIVFIVAVTLFFEYLNGVNNAGNSVATIVSTRVLSPGAAVALAAFFNFAAAFVFGVKVANTVGKGVVDPGSVTALVIFAAVISSSLWVHFCTVYGIPISASHALIGGLIGAAAMSKGFGVLKIVGILKICSFIFIAPFLGLVFGFVNMIIIYWLFRRVHAQKVDKIFRKLQLVSAALYSLGHGTNDAQKAMGIIAILLFSTGRLGPTFYIPWWVIMACHTAIGLGTMMGGWRVVKTMGTKITKLQPVGGCAAETAGAITIFGATALGIPVSTTHIITGAIMGVGTTRGLSSVRWTVARRIIWAWVFTIPASALVSAATFFILKLF